MKQVQIALLARGLYEGPVDGIVGPALRAALRAHQAANGLPITGTITPAVLDSLKISSS